MEIPIKTFFVFFVTHILGNVPLHFYTYFHRVKPSVIPNNQNNNNQWILQKEISISSVKLSASASPFLYRISNSKYLIENTHLWINRVIFHIILNFVDKIFKIFIQRKVTSLLLSAFLMNIRRTRIQDARRMYLISFTLIFPILRDFLRRSPGYRVPSGNFWAILDSCEIIRPSPPTANSLGAWVFAKYYALAMVK